MKKLNELSLGDRFRYPGERGVWAVYDLDYGSGAVKTYRKSPRLAFPQIGTIRGETEVEPTEDPMGDE